MNNSLKFLLLGVLIICVGCNKKVTVQNNSEATQALMVTDTVTENNGLTTISSPYDVTDTTNRLEKVIRDKGLTLFTRIDHSANAQQAGEELKPTQLLIFGNPKVGTPLMQCSATTAIDLPQKILVWQNDNNQTQITYNMPAYLQQRHTINDCDEVLEKVSGVLKNITEQAIK